jgi:hypothetical protein
MRIGFYAPLKSPKSSVPSGDRKMARMLFQILESLGHEVFLLSELRTWEGKGDLEDQNSIRVQSELVVKEIENDIRNSGGIDCVFVYHLYHKAPDWIGLKISEIFNVPYLVTEASYAPKQANGKWVQGHEQVKRCLEMASGVLSINLTDIACVKDVLKPWQHQQSLNPFIEPMESKTLSAMDRNGVAKQFGLDISSTWLICSGMMRSGDKMASYRELSRSLNLLTNKNWALLIIGDGEMRSEVEILFKKWCHQVAFIGKVPSYDVRTWLNLADIYVWPGINEAYGLALLEGVSVGLPSVSYRFGGIPSIIESGFNGYVLESGEINGYSDAVDRLISDIKLRKTMSQNANVKYKQDHSMTMAEQAVNQFLNESIGRRAS